MKQEYQIVRISRDGRTIRCVYDDRLGLTRLGKVHVERALLVEFNEETQVWEVLDPTTKKALLGQGFESRQEALEAEQVFLNAVLMQSKG